MNNTNGNAAAVALDNRRQRYRKLGRNEVRIVRNHEVDSEQDELIHTVLDLQSMEDIDQMAAVIGPLELEDLRYVYDTLRTLAYDMRTKMTDPAADCERNMPNLRKHMAAIAGLHVNMSLIEALRPDDLSEAHAATGMEFVGGVWRFRSDECDDELLRRIEAEGNLPLSKSLTGFISQESGILPFVH